MGFWYRIKLLIFISLVCSTFFVFWVSNTIDSSRIHILKFSLFHETTRIENDRIRCSALIRGDPNEIQIAKKYMNKNPRKNWTTSREIINMTKECNSYKKNRRYVLNYLTEEEEHFPLAYSIMIFKDIEQVERLLIAIYRPQNYYCIHIDKKSEAAIHEAMRSITSCFSNVFLVANPVDVHWGGYSVLEPSLHCLQKLSKYKKWKYFMNLSGQEFPIRTNYELVRILKVYNGTNDIESQIDLKRRFAYRVIWVWHDEIQTTQANTQPRGINLYKGEYHVALARSFVEYILNNNVAKTFLKWLKTTGHPDETFFNTLNHNPRLTIPGTPKGQFYPDYSGKYLRYKLWHRVHGKQICHGKYHRHICIMGVGDLQVITKSPALFVNKFHLDFEPLALDCMEEWFARQTRKFFEEPWRFNESLYRYPPE